MSSNWRRFVARCPAVVDIGCSCRRPKLSSFFSSSRPKFRSTKSHRPLFPSTTISTSSLWDTSLTAATTSPHLMSSPSLPPYSAAERPKWRTEKKTEKAKKKGAVEESMAVVKESSDPYIDFRDSMLLMIMEMEIYEWDDLRDLIHRFLSLNSPSHHYLIFQASHDSASEIGRPTLKSVIKIHYLSTLFMIRRLPTLRANIGEKGIVIHFFLY